MGATVSAITAENRDFWQKLANDLGPSRPDPGKRVLVVGGRKHKGKTGTVVRHRRDQFYHWYCVPEANAHLREMAGRAGFVVLVQTESDLFWIRADYVEVQP